MAGMIEIKSVEIFRHLMQQKYAPMLIDVALDAIHLLQERDLSVCVTSAFRPMDEGVHGTKPGRGLDLRTWEAKEEVWQEICNILNKAFRYDPKRPHMVVAMFHDVGRGPHLHLQVHPNTIKI